MKRKSTKVTRGGKVTSFKSAGSESQSAIVNTDNMFNAEPGNSQYSDKPINPTEDKIVIQDLQIQSVRRGPLEIEKYRAAHQSAENRYYFDRVWLYDIYDDVLIDGHLSGIIGKRIDTVLNKNLLFKVDGKDVPELNDLINSHEFRTVCRTILETQFWGISGLEFVPGKDFHPRLIPRKHINTKLQIISIQQGGQTGIDYTDARNIMITGEPEDLGLLLKCSAYVIYKRHGIGDWSQYISIFGQPIRVMKYNTTDQQAKIELKQVLDKSGGALALMIPNTVDFQLFDKQSNGDGKLQETFINFTNKEMSVMVLGNTETTSHDGKTGTGAKSEVHKEQQDEITKSDMFYLLSYLNSEQFRIILKSYGYPVDGGRFVNSEEISIKYLAERITIDMGIVEANPNLPIDDDYWYNTYGIPKPENYDELKAKLEEMNESIRQQLGNQEQDNPDDLPIKPKKPNPTSSRPSAYPMRRVSKLRNLYNAFAAFFGQARR